MTAIDELWWVGNLWTTVLFGLVVTSICCACLQRKEEKARDLLRWRFELTAIGLGAISLFPTIVEGRSNIESIEQTYLQAAYLSSFERMADQETTVSYLCRPFNRSEHAPDTFDKVEAERVAMCDWARAFSAYVSELDARALPELDNSKMESAPTVTSPVFQGDIDDIGMQVTEYNDRRNDLVENKRRLEDRKFFLVYTTFAPYFLAGAVGAAIASVVSRRPTSSNESEG